MAKLKATSFTAYDLTEEEELEAQILPQLTIQYLQTLLAEFAEALIGNMLDTEYVAAHIDAINMAKGKIELLQHLLASHDAAITRKQQLVEANAAYNAYQQSLSGTDQSV